MGDIFEKLSWSLQFKTDTVICDGVNQPGINFSEYEVLWKFSKQYEDFLA